MRRPIESVFPDPQSGCDMSITAVHRHPGARHRPNIGPNFDCGPLLSHMLRRGFNRRSQHFFDHGGHVGVES